MHAESRPTSTGAGYSGTEITKAPNWHGLVAWDVFLNNMAIGLFLVTAVADLSRPDVFASLSRAGYLVALVVLLADLTCLVFDLGDPLRFHHMLRVFKPSSPMSLGTWCLTVFSLPLTLIVAINILPGGRAALGWLHLPAVIIGLLPALGSMVYKGVLFSTSSQPGWKDARWLGGYLVNSALLLGVAELLALALIEGNGHAAAILRQVLGLALLLNLFPLSLLLVELTPALSRSYDRAGLIRLATMTLGLGMLVPLGLSIVTQERLPLLVGVTLIFAGSLVIRFTIVKLPHHMKRKPESSTDDTDRENSR
jgi:formate-dependent nitrite reductase membrane component NrfD